MERMYTLDAETVADANGILEAFRDQVAPLFGWEVWDDEISTNKRVILKSDGYGTDKRFPCYLMVHKYSNMVFIG